MPVFYDIFRDEVNYMKKNDWFLAAGILAAVSGAELGGMPAPEGFQMVDVIAY